MGLRVFRVFKGVWGFKGFEGFKGVKWVLRGLRGLRGLRPLSMHQQRGSGLKKSKGLGVEGAQRLQNPLIKESTLNHIRVPILI